jgi:hypothetical protein
MNGVRNETIGHGRSGYPFLCPVARLVSCPACARPPQHTDKCLFSHGPGRPLAWAYITPTVLTTRIRIGVALHPEVGRHTAD